MFRVTERLYRTVDGRLVKHGDADAAFLAFTPGQELSDEEASRYGLVQAPKLAARPRDKMAGRPADKAVRSTTTKESAP